MSQTGLSEFGKISIADAMSYIGHNKFYLPMLQRDYVWDVDRIVNLFDSLYREYPISNLILLKIDKKIKNIKFYEFRKMVDEDKMSNIEHYQFTVNDDEYCVMDGQQRLTSLFLGLCSSSIKQKNDNYEIYFNVLNNKEPDNIFAAFKYRVDSFENKSSCIWFKLKDIIEKDVDELVAEYKNEIDKTIYKQNEKGEFIVRNNGDRIFKRKTAYRERVQNLKNIVDSNFNKIQNNIKSFLNLYQDEKVILYDVININDICNSEVTDENVMQDYILNVFFRLNSGGKALTPADLLYSKVSMIAMQNGFGNVRSVLSKYLTDLNTVPNNDSIKKLNFSVDLFMRCIWFIFGDKTFNNFLKSNEIVDCCKEDIFKKIKDSLVKARDFYKNSNNDLKNIHYNMLLPIAYYFYYDGDDSNESLKEISCYFATSALTRYFGHSSDSVLMKIRNALKNKSKGIGLFKDKKFDYKKLKNAINENSDVNSLRFEITQEIIKNVFKYRYGKNDSDIRKILFLLNSDWMDVTSAVDYQEDHIHAKSLRENEDDYMSRVGSGYSIEKHEFFKKHVDDLVNLQMLEPEENNRKDKTELKVWLLKEKDKENIIKRNLIPHDSDDDLELVKFETFYEKRRQLIADKLCEIFDIEKFEIN